MDSKLIALIVLIFLCAVLVLGRLLAWKNEDREAAEKADAEHSEKNDGE